MDLIKDFYNLNLISQGDDIYSSMSFNGVKNLHQKKILPIDIDSEDINVLKRITTIIYTNYFDKINIYKSRRGYTILCYSQTLSTKDQYKILFDLRKEGVDTSSVIQSRFFQKYAEPFKEDFFITRTGFKFMKLNEAFSNNNFSSIFEENLKKDIFIIVEFLKYFSKVQNGVEKIMERIEEIEKKIFYFKDFFYFYKKLDLIKAYQPIIDILLNNSEVATKKYLGTIQKDDHIIPDNVEYLYNVYNKETGALKENIKFLI